MHLGSLTSIASLKPKNFRHILVNNEVHESVGGQETSAKSINIPKLVKSNGYSSVFSVKKRSDINNQIEKTLQSEGPAFLEIIIITFTLDIGKNLFRICKRPI